MKVIATTLNSITVDMSKFEARGIARGVTIYIDKLREILSEKLEEE